MFSLSGCEFWNGLEAGSLLHRAEKAALRGKGRKALQFLNRAKRVQGAPPDILAAIGWVYIHIGRPDEGIECLKRAVSKKPRAASLVMLGWALFEQGKTEEAEKVLKEAYRRYPDNPEVMNSLGYFYAERGRNLKEAVRLLERALRKKPRAYHIVDSLGWAYFKMGRLLEAKKELEKAVQLGGKGSAEVRYHLAMVYHSLGMRKSALREVREALSLDPFYAPAQILYLRLTAKGRRVR